MSRVFVSVLIENSVRCQIRSRCENEWPIEAGGLLLGYRKPMGLHIVEATFPGPSDIRTTTRFVRRDQSHQQIATQLWKSSHRTIDWLGEWHSHPEPYPSPSPRDETTWLDQSAKNALAMVYLIEGYEGEFLGLSRNGGDIVRFVPDEADGTGILYSASAGPRA